MKRFGFVLVAMLAALISLSSVSAAENYALFGDAQIVAGGNPGNAAQIRSDADPGFGGVSYAVPAGLTFGTFDVLSTDYMPEADDICILGSPRFGIGIDQTGDGVAEGFIFAYFGENSGSVPCVPGTWQNTTDFLETGKLLDTTQLPGGTFYDPYDAALAKYGSATVTSIFVVVDAGPAQADGEQTFLIDNTNVDGAIYTFEPNTPSSKDDCKDGGFMTVTRADGSEFKNQGDCIQFVESGK